MDGSSALRLSQGDVPANRGGPFLEYVEPLGNLSLFFQAGQQGIDLSKQGHIANLEKLAAQLQNNQDRLAILTQ
jgi:hypothetical protein